MPPMSAKNLSISPASMDLGLGAGDALATQLEDATEEMKRKKAMQSKVSQTSPVSAAAADLGMLGISPAGGMGAP